MSRRNVIQVAIKLFQDDFDELLFISNALKLIRILIDIVAGKTFKLGYDSPAVAGLSVDPQQLYYHPKLIQYQPPSSVTP